MRSQYSTGIKRKPTNLSISAGLIDEAKCLGINLSKSAENGIEEAIRQHKISKWLEENQEAIASSNEFVEKEGLPLARFRQF